MRVKNFVKMYRGMRCVEVEIYATVTIFNEEYHVLVRELPWITQKSTVKEKKTSCLRKF